MRRNLYLATAVLAWALGVCMGSQAPSRRPYQVPNPLRPAQQEAGVRRLVAALAEVGDAVTEMAAQRIF